MRVLILGGSGMLGHKLSQLYRAQFDTWATVRSTGNMLGRYRLLDPDRILEGVDAMRLSSVARAIDHVQPDAVINCIGVIKQLCDDAHPIQCLAINALFPHQLAELCRAKKIRLIHISTDCVFSGRKGMCREEDVSDAEDLYGRSKFLGEISGPHCLTLRTSIIGRELNTANGLVEWFLSNRGGKVRGFCRAVYTGFTTRALADIIGNLLNNHRQLEGSYQVSAEPINKHDLLCLINERYQLGIQIEPDTDFSCDRSLDSTKLRQAIGFQSLGWREMIHDMYQDPTPYDEWKTAINIRNAKEGSLTSCSLTKCS